MSTRLGRAIEGLRDPRHEKSGVLALSVPEDAFAARVLLAGAAERGIDAQYYIWHDDVAGLLLLEALWQAAERGVRVRLLLDDNSTAGLDPLIADLDAHPSIEVRLYNPVRHRRFRAIDYLTDFLRMNRRMHNKAFAVDGEVAILGGRNVGNEYFGAGDGVTFADLDVLAVGAVAPDVVASFEAYWSSKTAIPAARLLARAPAGSAERLRSRFEAARSGEDARRFLEAVRKTPFVSELLEGGLDLEWTRARLFQDDPAKTRRRDPDDRVLLLPRLLGDIGEPARCLDIVSPYFVPMADGSALLAEIARRGVRVRVLTNSLEATDVGAVHAGYAKRRKRLLRAGVKLYELERSAGLRAGHGSSSASLHAKTFAVDDRRVFVGSVNLDPRSALLNTENGLLIDSPALARQISASFDSRILLDAYEVGLRPDGGLVWIDRTGDGEVRYDHDPRVSPLRRAAITLLSHLPIEWLL